MALNNQKLKLERDLAAIAKEEQKLEMLRKKRQELYSNPFKHLKEEDSKKPAKKGKKRTELDDLDGKTNSCFISLR